MNSDEVTILIKQWVFLKSKTVKLTRIKARDYHK